ncbi:HlyC/CorC family transporter [Afifella pfennigii]|uniref:HlyC/CorC family transporter n=1 Tax=Afifella pfennigii TaxID=209897 RepID=UPI00047E15A7|nr:HlyC/CorC family transporter [Afifella pfennigii]
MWLWAIVLAVLFLLLLSAFFSGSETALTAASRARMHQLEKSGEAHASIVGRLIDRKERMISSLLLGNNLVNILASALATAAFIEIFGDAGVAVATLVMTLLVLVFAEVLPKTWAITMPDRFSLAVGPFVTLAVKIFAPVVATVERIVSALLRLFGVNASGNMLLSGHEELRGAVDLLHREGSVQKGDRDMLGGLLDLNELDVSDVMVHRTAMQALNADEPPARIVEQVMASSFTRLPLWRGETENIVGVLHAKDVLRALAAAKGDAASLDIMEVAAKPWFVPDTTSLQAQLNEFLRRKTHFALVVDEYGEVMGLITLEDILEEIVGEIADEHDIEIQGVRQQPDGSIIVEGAVPIRDLNRAFDWSLPDEEATTMAGLVIHEAQTIPEAGQEFTFHGFRFKVLRKSRNRITQIRVTPMTAAEGKALLGSAA